MPIRSSTALRWNKRPLSRAVDDQHGTQGAQCVDVVDAARIRFGSLGFCGASTMSALPPKADMCDATSDVRYGPIADIVTSRAVAPLGKLAGWSLPLVRRGGEMIAMKGSSVAEELERDAALIRKAGGGRASISTVGDAHLAEPTTIIRVPRVH